ncbi:MAG: phosphotransferase [Polyangiaceae bacterium]
MTEPAGPRAHASHKTRAIEAATGAGRALGLEVGEPVVLHDGFSMVVHLAPSPVVVRVPRVLPAGLALAAQSARQAREIAVVQWLDEQGFPVVRPSALVPRTPVTRDGFSMTFWEKVEIDASAAPDFLANAARVVDLHAALRACPVALPFLSPLAISVPGGLAHLDANPTLIEPSDLAKANAEWRVLAPVMASAGAFRTRFPRARVQPIHGDAPAYNLVTTTTGIRHADFEDATLGTPEWDVAAFGPEVHAAYDAAAERSGLPPLDADVLRVMQSARSLQMVACLAIAPQYPGLAEAIAPMIAEWRGKPLIVAA